MNILQPRRAARGLRVPGGVPRIDWSNPLTAGLVGCFIPLMEGSPSLPVIRELVTGFTTILNGTAAAVIATPTGIVAKAAASGNGGFQFSLSTTVASPQIAAMRPTRAVTLLWMGSILGAGSAGGTIMAGYSLSLGHYLYGLTRDISTAGTTNMNFQTNQGGVAFNFQLPGVLPSATATPAICVLGSVMTGATGNPTYAFVNGQQVASGTWGSTTAISYGASNTMYFCTSVGSTNSAAGTNLGLVWNRQLSLGEAAQITADPTAFLLWPDDYLFDNMVGAFGAITIFSNWLSGAERNAALLADAGNPIESLNAGLSTSIMPVEDVTVGAAGKLILPAERLSTMRPALVLPSESIAVARVLRTEPLESLISEPSVSSAVAEFLAAEQMIARPPVENAGADRLLRSLASESLGAGQRGESVATERFAGLMPAAEVAMEVLGSAIGIAQTYSIPIETRANVSGVDLHPWESIGTSRSQSQMAQEQTLAIRYMTVVPQEWIGSAVTVGQAYGVPIEWAKALSLLVLQPLVVNSAISVSDAVPVELLGNALAQIAAFGYSPIEWQGTFIYPIVLTGVQVARAVRGVSIGPTARGARSAPTIRGVKV